MNIIQQAKAKLKPPPPPPKPAHLNQATTTAPPQTQSTLPTTSPSTSHSLKRGIGWPWDYPSTLLPLFTTSPSSDHPPSKTTWLFNWELWVPAHLHPSDPSSLTWIPTVRTAAQCTDIIPFLTDITTNQHRHVTHLLGFNEPEIPSQANLPVDEAVRLWRQFVLPAKAKFDVRLGSPGMSSDVGKCIPWLDVFFERLGGNGGGGRIGGAGVDFLVLHWYGLRFGDMRSFLERMYERYGLPVWVNEFACSSMGDGEASVEDVESFLREAVPWLEGCGWVERYAYFGNGQGMDVGSWVGRGSNFTEEDKRCEETGGRRLTRVGKLYMDL